jgi:hypothetical protein
MTPDEPHQVDLRAQPSKRCNAESRVGPTPSETRFLCLVTPWPEPKLWGQNCQQ